MNTLNKIWSIRVANFYHEDIEIDQDIVLDLDFEILDKDTCMVINHEISCINIFQMVNGKVTLAETFEGDTEGCEELYKILLQK